MAKWILSVKTTMKGISIMQGRHGVLESAILRTLWSLEQNGIYTNSVKDVYIILSKNEDEKRAYTTIKTVMDRLYEKNMLLRFKQGKKFFYRTAYSSREIISDGLNELANRYCNGDLGRLALVLQELAEEKRLVSV